MFMSAFIILYNIIYRYIVGKTHNANQCSFMVFHWRRCGLTSLQIINSFQLLPPTLPKDHGLNGGMVFWPPPAIPPHPPCHCFLPGESVRLDVQ